MCLILFSIHQHPEYKFILAANRDEFFDRETLYANRWQDNEQIIGGRDVVSGGTWLGLNSNGRFIAITNYRDPARENKSAKSRGILSNEFLNGNNRASDFIHEISPHRANYNGFNLLISDDGFNTLSHYSNINNEITMVQPGIHGLSNALLNTSWPKVDFGKNALSKTISSYTLDINNLISILGNADVPADHLLPSTGISFDLEQKLSPVFISMNGYGTRCSTVLLVNHNNVAKFHEVSYNENKEIINIAEFQIQLKY